MAQLANQVLISRTLVGTASVASGSSWVDGVAGASVDMANYDGCLFLQTVTQGGTGGNVSFTVRGSTAAIVTATSGGQGVALSGSTSTVAAGSSATSEGFAIDVYRPRLAATGSGRFLFGQITVASSCSMVGQQFAVQYQSRTSSITATTAFTAVAGVPPNSTAATTGTGAGLSGGVVRAVSPSS